MVSPRLLKERRKWKRQIILGSDHFVSTQGDGLGFPSSREGGPLCRGGTLELLSGRVMDLSLSSVQPSVCVKRKSPSNSATASFRVRTLLWLGDPFSSNRPVLIPATLSPRLPPRLLSPGLFPEEQRRWQLCPIPFRYQGTRMTIYCFILLTQRQFIWNWYRILKISKEFYKYHKGACWVKKIKRDSQDTYAVT